MLYAKSVQLWVGSQCWKWEILLNNLLGKIIVKKKKMIIFNNKNTVNYITRLWDGLWTWSNIKFKSVSYFVLKVLETFSLF